MPTPVGHAVAGIAAGWLVGGTPRGAEWRERGWREAALFGLLGALPDVDLLVGVHREPTHSIGAALIVGIVALILAARTRLPWPALVGAACGAAYGSHVLLDWLARDSSPPYGVMALWPFSRAYYDSDLDLFMAVSRRYYQGWTFVWQNTLALAWELLILMPILAVIMLTRSRRRAD